MEAEVLRRTSQADAQRLSEEGAARVAAVRKELEAERLALRQQSVAFKNQVLDDETIKLRKAVHAARKQTDELKAKGEREAGRSALSSGVAASLLCCALRC